MFLDELEKAYLVYQKKALNLKKIQRRELSKINQAVCVRDLVVIRDSDALGESKNYTDKNKYQQSSDSRIRAQINIFFKLANEDHIARNCERDIQGKLQLKRGKENHITRLSTQEFSFYTQKPLTIQEYQKLYEDILVMAEEMEPNVHVLLSSFAIKDSEGQLINMSLFVEGGKPAIIHAFSKNTASLIDIDYDKSETIFSQQSAGKDVSFHAENITKTEGETISTGSVFELTTQGGAKFTQAIDVCLDHFLGHGKALISRRLLNEAQPDEVFPEQVEQCVTSSTVSLYKHAMIGDRILHVDSLHPMPISYKAPASSNVLSNEAICRIENKAYPLMKIVELETGYRLRAPPFGSDLTIDVLDERPAGKYTIKLKLSILKHNHQVYERRLHFEAEATSKNVGLISKIAQGETVRTDQSEKILKHMNSMEGTLLDKCRYGFFEKLYNTVEYIEKRAAQNIIKSSFSQIKKIIKDRGDASILMLHAWKKNLDFRLGWQLSESSDLKKHLTEDIEKLINQDIREEIGFQSSPNQQELKTKLKLLTEDGESSSEPENQTPISPKSN